MGEHYFCDICRWLNPTEKNATIRGWRIDENDFMLHLGSHTSIEFIMYARHITFQLYHNNGKYDVENEI